MQFETFTQDLAHSAEIIRALLLGVTPTDSRFKPNPESWSMLEMLCHVTDVEREDFRPHLESILRGLNEQWAPLDPSGWVTARQYNERDLAEALAAFSAERDQSLKWLKSLSAPNLETEHIDRYGSITAGEMLSSWIAHDNLHTRQLVELRRERLVRLAAPFDVGYAGEW